MIYFKEDANLKLSTYFRVGEFQSKDGFEIVAVSSELVRKLSALRSALGKPIIVNSGYRSPAHNKAVGGAKKSRHMLGCAADITVRGMKVADLAAAAQKTGFTGVIQYPKQNFVHVDVGRTTPYYAISK